MIYLKIKEKKKEPRDFHIEKFPVTIGRSRDNIIKISNPFFSREHCRIEKTDKGYTVEDLGSKNGIKVNGQQVTRSDISSGDVISIGNTRFTFIVDGESKEKKHPSPKRTDNVSAKEQDTAASEKENPALPASDEEWKKQLEDEEINQCGHCGTLYSISYEIPGVGIFCPNCRTKYPG